MIEVIHITLPERLKKKEFRFILIAKSEKRPMEKEWTTRNNYVFDDPKFQSHVESQKNYGIATGFGGIIVLDFDSGELFAKLSSVLPETFTVQSGSGLIHLYFITDDTKSFKILDKDKNTLLDVQGSGKQIVGPGSIHPNGNPYSVVKDIDITTLASSELKAILVANLPPELLPETLFGDPKKKAVITHTDPSINEIRKKFKITDLLKETDVDVAKNPTSCPLHSSKGGRCFSINPTDEIWNCFHCTQTGDVIELYMLINNLTFPQAKQSLCDKLGIKNIKPPKKNGKQEDEEKPVMTTRLNHDDTSGRFLAEQVYKDKKHQFAVWNGNEVEYHNKIVLNEIEYIPRVFANRAGKKDVRFFFPTDAIDYGTTDKLIQEIQEFIHKWMDVSPQFERICAWYVLVSWVHDKLRTICYLRARGQTGCGKTRFLNTVSRMCYHSITGDGVASVAAVYRLIDAWHCSLTMDEADFSKSDEKADMIKILNTGFQRDGYVLKVNTTTFEVEPFPTYGPKILATRHAFDDKALESRCITEIMTITRRQDIPIDLTSAFDTDVEVLRNKCLMWRFKNYDKIDSDKGVTMDLGNAEPRIKQVMVSFAALFHAKPEMMIQLREMIDAHQASVIEEREDSRAGYIVKSLFKIIFEKLSLSETKPIKELAVTQDDVANLIITSAEIADRVNNDYFPNVSDKKINPAWIGREMRTLKVESRKPIFHNNKTIRPINLSNFDLLGDLLSTYFSDSVFKSNCQKLITGKITGPSGITGVSGSVPRQLKNNNNIMVSAPVSKDGTLDAALARSAAPISLRRNYCNSCNNVGGNGGKNVNEMIKNVIKNHGQISVVDLKKHFKIDEKLFDKTIETLKKVGDVFEPKNGELRLLK